MNISVCVFRPIYLILSFWAFTFTTVTFAQQWIPEHYYGISQENFKDYFHDSFQNNDGNWDMEQPSWYAHSDEEGLTIKSSSDEPLHYSRGYEFDKNKNYQISTSFRFLKPQGKAGLAFAMDGKNNGYMFLILPDKHFQLIKLMNGAQEILQESVYPLGNGNNELTFRKVDESWYFFINANGVLHYEAQYMPSSSVGWAMVGDAEIVVDDLRIQNIEVSDTKGPLISIIRSPQNMEITRNKQNNIYLCKTDHLVVTGHTGDLYGVKEISIENENHDIIDHTIIESTQDGTRFSFSLNLVKDTTVVYVSSIDVYENPTLSQFKFVKKKAESIVREMPQDLQAEQEPKFYPSSTSQKTRNIALFFGIDEYKNWLKLNNAVLDCKSIASILKSQYQFDEENVFELYDEQVTRENVTNILDSLQNVLGKSDNLIIYFAGHGSYNENSKFGYWVPWEARENKACDYISNNDIKEYLKAIKTRHTLVIADACFAGSLMRSNPGSLSEDIDSRWVFTSGDLENVDDGPAGANSPFASALIHALKNNPEDYLRADALFKQVQKDMANSNQKPRATCIKEKELEQSGIFVFRKK